MFNKDKALNALILALAIIFAPKSIGYPNALAYLSSSPPL